MPKEEESEAREAVLKEVKDEGVKFIEMQFSDILGTVKSVAIPSSKLERALAEGIFIDGSSILGYATIDESDMRAQPIPSSFQIYPWTNGTQMKTARLLCQIYDHCGNRFKGDPRWALEKMVEKAQSKGLEYFVGPEFEFFLFNLDANGEPIAKPSDAAGYFDLLELDRGEEVRKEITLKLDEIGFDTEASHHEVAPGQHEIGMRFNKALTVADRIMTFKLAVKTIAKQHGFYASFMPKPLFGCNGSGMHVHQSLASKDKNLFDDPSDKFGLSKEAYYYLGGLLAHAPEMSAILNSQVNSYKRLVPGYEAPCYISWANMNRSALIRVPAGRGMKTRVEIRNPDPAGNPYLQFAVMLAAGLDGIEKKIEPPEPMERDIFHMSSKERAENGITSLPANLGDALEIMSKSDLMRDALGSHIFCHYLKIKNDDWDSYRTYVTDWEIINSLRKL